MDSQEKKKIDRQSASQTRTFDKRSPFVIIGTIVVLVIVVIAFVFVPAIEAAVGSGSEPSFTFGFYDGEEIKLAYGNYFAEQITAIQQNVPPEQMNNIFAGMQIYRQAFDNTVVHTAKMKEMEKAGFVIPNTIVDKEIIKLPNFQEDGVFSSALYQSVSNDQKMLLWNSIKEQLIAGTYDRSMVDLHFSAKELEFINSIHNTVRSFEMVSLPISSYPDAEVRAYAESNPDLFKQIHLSVITVGSSEREANNVLKSIQDGTVSFEDAAKNNSSGSYAEAGGDMGIKIAYELNAEIPEEHQQSIFSLANGALSSVVKVPNGWAFYRMNATSQNIDLNNTENLAKVRSYIQGYERGRIENWLIERADTFVAAARVDGFSMAASTASYEGFSSSSFGPVPLNYGDSEIFPKVNSFNIAELAQAGSDVNFWTHAFKTPLNAVSEPMIVGDNVIVLHPISETTGAENENDEAGIDSFLNVYYPYWANLCVNQNFSNQILKSDDLVDNFTATYIGLIQ